MEAAPRANQRRELTFQYGLKEMTGVGLGLESEDKQHMFDAIKRQPMEGFKEKGDTVSATG